MYSPSSNPDDTFVVLGSNSFSGSHFIAYLLERGHRVVGLSRSPEVDGPMNPYRNIATPDLWTFIQADVNDHEYLSRVLLHANPSHVVNFAAQSMVAQSWTYPEHWYQTNVVGVANLARTLQHMDSLEKYVHVTTPEVYGSTDGWIQESDDFRPSTPYAISRAAGDQHLMALAREQGFPVVFTRAANVYGPGQQLYRIVPRALLAARIGGQLTLDGGGRSLRSFVHIQDVAAGTYAAALHGEAGSTYHLSTSEVVTIRELVERVVALTGCNWGDLVVEGPERLGKDAAYMLESSRARSELMWAPEWSLDRGLEDVLAWVDANLTELARLPTTYQHKE